MVPPSPQHADVFGRNNVIVQIQGDGNTVVPGVAHLTLTRYLNRRRVNNLATLLSAVGRREEALEAGQEAVSIRRDLASSRPEAFRPDLAVSLFNLSIDLSDAGQNDQAVEASREAVELLVPFFLALPAAFGEWMVSMMRRYLHLMEETGRQPDHDLLAPLVEAGFFETESENPVSPDELSPDPKEESR